MRCLRALIATRQEIGEGWRAVTASLGTVLRPSFPWLAGISTQPIYFGGQWWAMIIVATATNLRAVVASSSADGITWTQRSTLWTNQNASASVQFGYAIDGAMYFCGRSTENASPSGTYQGPWVAKSTNGTSWDFYTGVTGTTSGTDDVGFVQLVGNGNQFFAIKGLDAVTGKYFTYKSTDFATWTLDSNGTSIAYGLGKFWITGRGSGTGLWYSTDLNSWVAVSNFTSIPVTKVEFAGGVMLAIQEGNPTRIFYSYDGIAWSESILPSGFIFYSTAFNLSVGAGTNLWHLTYQSSPTNQTLISSNLLAWKDISGTIPSGNTGLNQVAKDGPTLLRLTGGGFNAAIAQLSP